MADDDDEQKQTIQNLYQDINNTQKEYDTCLYSWGLNSCGLISDSSKDSFKIDPQVINLSLITRIKLIACGSAHTLLVD